MAYQSSAGSPATPGPTKPNGTPVRVLGGSPTDTTPSPPKATTPPSAPGGAPFDLISKSGDSDYYYPSPRSSLNDRLPTDWSIVQTARLLELIQGDETVDPSRPVRQQFDGSSVARREHPADDHHASQEPTTGASGARPQNPIRMPNGAPPEGACSSSTASSSSSSSGFSKRSAEATVCPLPPVGFGSRPRQAAAAPGHDAVTGYFHPNHADRALFSDILKVREGFSVHYAGDIFLAANRGADIPDDLNCSLFIVNLPPSLTVHRLIAAIHRLGPTGRIFAIHINQPEPLRGHRGCAAKVVFFRRDAAHHFHALSQRYGLVVDGQPARLMWNRIKTAEDAVLCASDASRVLLIGGPPAFVNEAALTAFFRTKLDFQVDEVITWLPGGEAETAVVEYRFGSFRCQAQAAKMALAREHPEVKCFFASDPLEWGAWSPAQYSD